MPRLIFEYAYRDAGNFKAFGAVWLSGSLQDIDQTGLIDCLEARTFFVAEQVGLPPLYDELFRLSGGPIEDDHAWHEFVGIREPQSDEQLPSGAIWGPASQLFSAFAAAGRHWKPELSPNFAIGIEWN